MNSETKHRGRPKNIHIPIKYFTEKERKDAIRRSNVRYMVNKEWMCIVCDNHNYTLSGKCKHLRTKKHMDAVNRIIKGEICNYVIRNIYVKHTYETYM